MTKTDKINNFNFGSYLYLWNNSIDLETNQMWLPPPPSPHPETCRSYSVADPEWTVGMNVSELFVYKTCPVTVTHGPLHPWQLALAPAPVTD